MFQRYRILVKPKIFSYPLHICWFFHLQFFRSNLNRNQNHIYYQLNLYMESYRREHPLFVPLRFSCLQASALEVVPKVHSYLILYPEQPVLILQNLERYLPPAFSNSENIIGLSAVTETITGLSPIIILVS